MKHINKNHRGVSRRLALIGLFAALTLPSVSSATNPVTPTTDEVTPITAATDAPCEQNVVGLKIDTSTGVVYLVDSAGDIPLDEDELNVYFGALTAVVLDLEFTTGEWEVEISPTGSSTEVYYTRGGALRYIITDTPDEYVLSFTEQSTGASTRMMNMAPVIPIIIVKPDKNCPPPT